MFGAQAIINRLQIQRWSCRAGRKLVYGVLMAHPARVPRDHTIGDLRGFRAALPALQILLGEAAPFTGEIPADVPVLIAWAARDLVLPPWQAFGVRLAHEPDSELVVAMRRYIADRETAWQAFTVTLRHDDPQALATYRQKNADADADARALAKLLPR